MGELIKLIIISGNLLTQKKKYKSQNLDLNYYDKGDKFIDDDEDDEQGQGMQMQLCEVFYDDFVCFNGGTVNFYQSEYY